MSAVPLPAPELPEESACFNELLAAISSLEIAEQQLLAALDVYRRKVAPMMECAAMKLSGNESAAGNMFFYRAMLADSHAAQDAMRACIKHSYLSYESAMYLHKTLNGGNA